MIAVDDQRPLASRFQAIRLVTAGKRENAEGRAISLFGMRTIAHHPLDQNGGVHPDPCRLVQKRCRRRVGITLVGFGHMLVDRDMPGSLRTPDMAGNPLVIEEYLDHPVGQTHIDLSADQAMRHRVEGLVDLDMVIGMDLGRFPFRIVERCCRQRRKRRSLDLLEQLTARLCRCGASGGCSSRQAEPRSRRSDRPD